MFRNEITIAGRAIGPGHPPFIIAEAGVNHNGDPGIAMKMVDAAVQAGADAVKFQTGKAGNVISGFAPKARYQIETTGKSESQLDMVRKLELPFDVFVDLHSYCKDKGIIFLSTPFDNESVDFLGDLGVSAFKLPSGEITNFPLLERAAGKGKPLILSSGMSTMTEVEEALETISASGCDEVVLLHCVSNYPTDPADVNLKAMRTMEEAFKVPVGYSDHTMGIDIPLAAAALGACVLEKHFTLDRDQPGPDHQASLEPRELEDLVRRVKIVDSALGDGIKKPVSSELEVMEVIRKSLVAAKTMKVGKIIEISDIAIKRPGTGIPPKLLGSVVGLELKTDVEYDEVLTWDHFGIDRGHDPEGEG